MGAVKPVPGSLDTGFARLALLRGYVSLSILAECVEEQRHQAEREETPLGIGQILLKRDAITMDQLLGILREQKGVSDGSGETRFYPQDTSSWRQPSDPVLPPDGFCLANRRYRLVRRIAQGTVYEAEDPALGRKVALKIFSGQEEQVGRLQHGAKLAASLSHPNIIRIHEFGTLQESPAFYISMDYVDGPSLERATATLSLSQRIEVVEKVAKALAYAHKRGIIHRDLSPSHILLTSAGDPVIINFGCARDGADGAPVSETRLNPETIRYRAPEQILGSTRHGPWTDVWTLGVLLYEALTDRSPFRESGGSLLLDSMLNQRPTPIRSIRPGVSPELEKVCFRALRAGPEEPYTTVEEFANDLGQWGAKG